MGSDSGPSLAAVVAAAIVVCLSGCGFSGERAAVQRPSGSSSASAGRDTPVDLGSLTPAEILARAGRASHERSLGAYRQRVLNGSVAILDVNGQYDRARGISRVDVESHYPLTDRPPSSFGLVATDGQDYLRASAHCYVKFRMGLIDADLGEQNETWLEPPDEVLTRLVPQRYDTYSLRLDATVPTRVAATLLGLEILGGDVRLPLDAMQGQVPVTLRMDDQGNFVELDVVGTDLQPHLRGVPSVTPAILDYVGHLRGQLTDEGASGRLSAPPASEVQSTTDGCEDTATTT